MEGIALVSVGISGLPTERKLSRGRKPMNNNKDEPITKLGLGMGIGNQSTQAGSSKDSVGSAGTGANAGSKEEMMFATATPLSELVWSPRKGVSIKCADSSLPDKKFSTSCRERSNDIGSGGSVEEMTSKRELSASKIDREGNHLNKKENDICSQTEKTSLSDPDNRRSANTGSSSGPVVEARDVARDDSHIAGTQEALSSVISEVKQHKLFDTQNALKASNGSKEELPLYIEKDDNDENTRTRSIPSLGKQESTAENDLQNLKEEKGSIEVDIVAQKPADEGLLPTTEVPRTVEASADGDEVPKEKVPSNEEVNEKILKDEDDSHESVESCNSTGLQSSKKRKWSFDQQSILERKKMKQQDHESSHFGSLYKQDNSFMNWISNMVKGLSNSVPNDTPSLAITMGSNRGYNNNETSTGFGTVFKTLYCPSSKPQMKVSEFNSSPSSGDNKGIQLLLSNEGFNQRISAAGEGPSAPPNMFPEKIRVVQGKRDENATSGSLSNMTCNPKKVGLISSGSSFRNDSGSPSEGKEASKSGSVNPSKIINNCTNTSDPLGNLWITRFAPKVSGHVESSLKFHQNFDLSSEVPMRKILSHDQNFKTSPKDKNDLEDRYKLFVKDSIDGKSKNIQNYVPNRNNSSFVFRRREHIDQMKHKSKLNSVNHSQRFKNSEALASGFARRLDALRHIIPSEVDGNASHGTLTCFFCGIKGHKLQDCAEVTGSEIDNLLHKISQYDGKDESSCFCIRCFQINHWGIACPYTSKRKESHYDTKNPIVDSEVEVGKDVDIRTNSSTSTMVLDECGAGSRQIEKVSDGTSRRTNFTGTVLREKQNIDFCSSVHRHIPSVPRGTFEAIKRLRLSRTDILKWTKSPTSLYCLDGYFLRLRLRNWEEGAGGTGYFVACISGEKSLGSHKLPLSVNIAGFKCSIESRFVSNHDYTEDELMAWWCAILRCGEQMPSEEDLKEKFEEKQKLGF